MRFKTTTPTVREAIIVESIGAHMHMGQIDYAGIMEFIVSRSEDAVSTFDLIDKPTDEVINLFNEAMQIAMQLSVDQKTNNNVDNVALSEIEKAKLSAIMAQMRERRAGQ